MVRTLLYTLAARGTRSSYSYNTHFRRPTSKQISNGPKSLDDPPPTSIDLKMREPGKVHRAAILQCNAKKTRSSCDRSAPANRSHATSAIGERQSSVVSYYASRSIRSPRYDDRFCSPSCSRFLPFFFFWYRRGGEIFKRKRVVSGSPLSAPAD